MRDEYELRERLSQLKVTHSDAVRNDLSDETVQIAAHKIRQLEWVLEYDDE